MLQKYVSSVRSGERSAFSDSKRLLKDFMFMTVCCTLGVLFKHMINPAANIITDALHIPGGISTAFSLMFMVLASGVTQRRWSASMMGSMQGVAAISIGMVGSMGWLMPLAYLLPGIVIDIVMIFPVKSKAAAAIKAFAACICGSLAAAIFADLVVFRLPWSILSVYLGVAAASGAFCGMLSAWGTEKIRSNMHKKNIRIILSITVIMVLVTAALTYMHLCNRQVTADNSLTISAGGMDHTVDIDSVNLTDFSTDIVNGKGDTKHISGKGIKLAELIGTSEFEEVSVIADDSYYATVTAGEIDNAWIVIEEGKARLIVENDKNSKRDVKNVVRIEVK